MSGGVLAGVTVIELAGIGPGPFCGMMLADHGARVIRIERPGTSSRFGDGGNRDILNRNRERIELDLKDPAAISELKELVKSADALIEGYRPGVIERMGIGPEVLLAINPKLVIGRMTGWGQEGPMAPLAGHDINYIALSGALHTYGRKGEKPIFPVNAVGDFGGGGMMLAFGVVAGILHARSGGAGQVVDCAMVDGAAILSAMTYTFLGNGQWRDERGVNLLDSGTHFYDTYETSDGKYISLGSIEPQFYALLLEKTGLAGDPDFAQQMNPLKWDELKARMTALILTKTRDEWCAIMDGTDICFAPVLSLKEAPQHPHNVARSTFVEDGGMVQPAPAPRFSATPAPPVSLAGR
ncbi:CaiB/BaiF CoA-transferase family protein [Novosphingobium sp.]|uniref:CaiB/BaiF CoA transferase family protein n=1 Tax=Novosphingobium sp. TaxID=1874826 RepID=UPI0022BF0D7D|nr:CaiB/BaiF CoA-transferase family protein [Novosphingobium sp.]MCZ8017564.1 CaiB/BaiF CoA-transferase family protein [Novosphingobium sp.]MCZ8033912.1 CaiB/BaiF CoA-transferase family protein [Novosphingobium sp.]MCZ8051268.1 CaiB/BaiF CoA-transferase family protein [Novosphingobium sp.]MCZ8059614.1 CaiB/BaiF CoA-transferase family protein [Novosphingobium sp.]MCZ8231452.1 CaiB/BaiF CoA-transferase family protein [Novosphingobium sp.]